ncbi:MBL fold metallo-hydrolase [Mesobacillus maritimus]|uniref:MBL fold metallo-hydrolase n=1 Tax=Mesobacillus maritimus TaxID=1643336 RepID=UPI00203FDED1|nr:MBL fold metallo-hydrolase [Mesobacillus maritimus]MCM3586650.1 MBL fold metallo-hydrolase [Mesobacillus maritimus]
MPQINVKEEVICFKGDVVKIGQKAGTVYLFLVDGMIIDTGPQCIESEIILFYKEHSFDLVTLTHSHEDHSGTAAWIQENHEVPIFVHEKGVHLCAEPCNYPKYRQKTWGIRREFRASPLANKIQSRTEEWEVIYTPGHAEDHVALFNKKTGRMFSGDLFVSPRTKVIMASESTPVTMESIRTLLDYDFGPMYCCHSGYHENGKALLRQKLDYLENITGEVKHLYHQGRSVAEINDKLFPTKYPIIEVSSGEWDSVHIITSVLAEEGIDVKQL